MHPIIDISVLDEVIDLLKEAAPKTDKDQLRATQRHEHELWHQWNSGGRKPEHLKPLYESYKPMLMRAAGQWRGVEMPTSTINAEMRKQFVNAVKTFDPKRGVQLSTWVGTNLRKSSRYMKQYQNLGKISEGDIGKIREYKQAKEHLSNLHGFEPDTQALADHLKWSPRQVARMQKELRPDKPVSGWLHDPAEILTPKELEAIRLLHYDNRLSPEERTVYEYTFGMNGKPRMQPGQIAKQTGIHPSKISRVRGRLKKYVQEAMEVL